MQILKAAVPTQHTCPSGRWAYSQLSSKLQSSEDSLQMNRVPPNRDRFRGSTIMKVKLLRALARCITALAVGTALFSVSAASRQEHTTNSRVQKGRAAFYSPALEGHKTACGGRYVASELTTAHRRLPCGTRVRITNTKNGKSVEATVNDWGPTPTTLLRYFHQKLSSFLSLSENTAGSSLLFPCFVLPLRQSKRLKFCRFITFREVKVAEFEHFPVFFPDNRELWEKVFSGQALTEDGKYAQRSRPEVLLAISRIPSTSVLSRRYLQMWLSAHWGTSLTILG